MKGVAREELLKMPFRGMAQKELLKTPFEGMARKEPYKIPRKLFKGATLKELKNP